MPQNFGVISHPPAFRNTQLTFFCWIISKLFINSTQKEKIERTLLSQNWSRRMRATISRIASRRRIDYLIVLKTNIINHLWMILILPVNLFLHVRGITTTIVGHQETTVTHPVNARLRCGSVQQEEVTLGSLSRDLDAVFEILVD